MQCSKVCLWALGTARHRALIRGGTLGSKLRWYLMTKKSRLRKAAKAVTNTAKRLVPTSKEARTVAGVALGAAAIAASGVVAKKVGDAVREGNAASKLQRMAVGSASKRRKSGVASRQRRTTKKRRSTKSSKRVASR